MNTTVKIILGIFIATLTYFPQVTAQNFSQDVYPSDEEIFEAYLRGDIDYTTYQNLVEIFEQGVDSSDLFLLDEIPNLDYFPNTRTRDFPELEKEQEEPFKRHARGEMPKAFSGNAGIRRFQSLEEDAAARNQYYFRYGLPSGWAFNTWLNGDSAGNREWANRSLKYANSAGVVKRIILGNFVANYGLGLTVGYRGRILSKDSTTWDKSFLFPDYGGFNGIYIEGGRQSDAAKMIVHYDKDATHEVQATGISLSKKLRHFKGEGIFLASRLENRIVGTKHNFSQLGYCFQYQIPGFMAAFESVLPGGTQHAFPAAILESHFNKAPFNLSLAAWQYSADYINPFGGGRSGFDYHTVAIEEIDLKFSDRRNDQKGILIKEIARIKDRGIYELSFSVYGKDHFQRSARVSTSLEIPISSLTSLRGDYRYAEEIDAGESKSTHSFRLEYILKSAKIFSRSYAGYKIDKNLRKYFSLFSRANASISKLGNVELWLNLDKLDSQDGKINYFYGYIKESVYATKNLELGMKYSYRYNRDYQTRSSSTFLLTGEIIW